VAAKTKNNSSNNQGNGSANINKDASDDNNGDASDDNNGDASKDNEQQNKKSPSTRQQDAGRMERRRTQDGGCNQGTGTWYQYQVHGMTQQQIL